MPGSKKSAPRKPSRREVPQTPDTVDALYPPLPERIPLTLESIAGDEPTYAEMLESICGATDDSQPVEQYDGTLDVTRAYVDAHQKQAVQVQWNSGLGGVFTNPGNVDGVRWGAAPSSRPTWSSRAATCSTRARTAGSCPGRTGRCRSSPRSRSP